VMLADGNWFEDHPGFAELPDQVKKELNAHLNSQYAPEDEV
jgi:hypothetical protein